MLYVTDNFSEDCREKHFWLGPANRMTCCDNGKEPEAMKENIMADVL
ncbi:hypothetical protein QUF72_15950 [Desulfobacterales bacterium HSG2]|nr:hypothetical protein [Desulfobacterales bacterium HSG2]